MHVIPWKLLREAFASSNPQDPAVTMPERIMRMLLEAALDSQAFNSAAYLAANPDVAEAIRTGKCPSAKYHYMNVGYFEGRNTGDPEFDEVWYLKRYPDVLRAVRQGKSASGLEHFRGPGVREWRSPNKEAEADINRWRTAIQAARKGQLPAVKAMAAQSPAATVRSIPLAAQPESESPPTARRRRAVPATGQISARP